MCYTFVRESFIFPAISPLFPETPFPVLARMPKLFPPSISVRMSVITICTVNYIVLHLLTIQPISNQEKLYFSQQNLLGHTKNNLHPNALDLRYLQATTLT